MEKDIMDNILMKVGWIIITLAVGFVFPIFFIITAYLMFTVALDLKPARISDQLAHQVTARKAKHEDAFESLTTDDIDWVDSFRNICESPAEVAFLNAMIGAYHLEPKTGQLFSSEIEFQMQVPIWQYRLDFLVNENLNVEIDGAKWHSSKKAKERDRIRDIFMKENDLYVLRIPAKIALYKPQDAIKMVKESIPSARAFKQKRKKENQNHVDVENKKRKNQRSKLTKPKFLLKSVGYAIKQAHDTVGELNKETLRKVEADKLHDLGTLTPESYFRDRHLLLHAIQHIIDLKSQKKERDQDKPVLDSFGINQRSRDLFDSRLRDALSNLTKKSSIVKPSQIFEDIYDISGVLPRFESIQFNEAARLKHARPSVIEEWQSRYLDNAQKFLLSLSASSERSQMFLDISSN